MSHWGAYPSIAVVKLTCKAANGGNERQRSFGDSPPPAGALPALGLAECNGSHAAINGLSVNYDRYIKDFKVRCAEIRTSGSSVRIDDDGYDGGWMLNQAQNNDLVEGLRCDDDSEAVLTGVRMQYKRDANETALTSVKLLCSRVRSTR